MFRAVASRQSEWSLRLDEGLALETSPLKLFTVTNLRYQHGW